MAKQKKVKLVKQVKENLVKQVKENLVKPISQKLTNEKCKCKFCNKEMTFSELKRINIGGGKFRETEIWYCPIHADIKTFNR